MDRLHTADTFQQFSPLDIPPPSLILPPMPTTLMPPKAQAAFEEALKKIAACRRKGQQGTFLDLRGLGLTQVPPEIGQLTALTKLYLHDNEITRLPPEIGRLNRLSSLKLQDNQLETLPDEIGSLEALVDMDISNNPLVSLPPQIGRLSSLERLGLHRNRLTLLPKEIGELVSLTVLHLDNNRLVKLPAEIGRLSSLLVLRLEGSHLTELPPEIGSLKNLVVLHLENNRLVSLPDTIGQLDSLKGLYLDCNKLTSLPSSFKQLSKLAELYLSYNPLRLFPDVLASLKGLTKLHLFDTQLESLPRELGDLSKLEEFSAAGNRINHLPCALGRLKELKELYLDCNQISSIPPEIGQLAALKELWLNNNRLTNLPPEIGDLRHLRLLILHDNMLKELPESLKSLTQLKELTLHGNDALGLPAKVLGPVHIKSGENNPPAKPRDILLYYFASLGDRGQALREMKVLVVGRGGVGKTSVIRRLKGLPLDMLQSETHGIAIEELSLPCADGSVGARVWDFGGQHVLHAMHEFFFTGRSLYVLVLGEREDTAERDAEYWLQLIRSYAGKAPVIVVMNKSGGRARELDLPRRKLEETYGPILVWLSTECHEPNFERGGIAALKQQITLAVGAMPEIQARFPKKWMQIKEWLSGMKESYLDYSVYAQQCSLLGEADPAKQEELAAFLHDLGVALNYRRDPRLHETTVLRPDWLADGIYALLRANDTRHPNPLAPNGRINLQQMPGIYTAAENLRMLKASDYPAEKHPFLLRLMAAFQLSFPLDEAGTEHLVPALLSVEEPLGIPSHFLENPRIELRWEFPVVPGPLLPRLLVRTLGLVKNDWRWRRGALYEFGPAVAKIWEEKERYIYLRAAAREEEYGPTAVADLVRMIRGTLREIVAEHKNLSVQEQVLWQDDWLPRRAAEALGVCEPEYNEDDLNQEDLS